MWPYSPAAPAITSPSCATLPENVRMRSGTQSHVAGLEWIPVDRVQPAGRIERHGFPKHCIAARHSSKIDVNFGRTDVKKSA